MARLLLAFCMVLGITYCSAAQTPEDLLQRAENGDVNAQYQLGEAYENGPSVDLSQALHWYEKAAAQEHVEAHVHLGDLYLRGAGVDQSYQRAQAYYRAAVKLGSVHAQAKLGMIYYYGAGVPQDYAEAAKWFLIPAENGDAEAQEGLSRIYLSGVGVPRDDAQALKWATKAAAQQSYLAMGTLGFMYEKGRGLPEDYLKAYIWYRKAVEGGVDFYLPLLARVSEKALTPQVPVAIQKKYTEQLANGQSAESIFSNLGDVQALTPEGLIEGDPFLKEHREFVKRVINRTYDEKELETSQWLEKSIVARGEVYSMVLLANLHLRNAQTWSSQWQRVHESGLLRPGGVTFATSIDRAVELLRTASDRGSPEAMMTLAALHELGLGVPRDLVAAEDIYRKAAPLIGARAELGRLRISLDAQWQEEIGRRDQIARQAAQEDIAPSVGTEDEISIIAVADSLDVLVQDNVGSRISNVALRAGDVYKPPQGRDDLILWAVSQGNPAYSIKVGGTAITLPEGFNYNDGLRLNAKLLRSGGNVAVRGHESPDDFPYHVPLSTLAKAHIVIEGLNSMNGGSIYYHNSDQTIGYYVNALTFPGRIHIPDVEGLTLELWPNFLSNRPAHIKVVVDGKKSFELTAPSNCLVTLALSPQKLATARVLPVGKGCDEISEGDSAVASVLTGSDEVVGSLQRRPYESILNLPPAIGEFSQTLNLASFWSRNAGRWDQALREETIGLQKLMRFYGPNSTSSLFAELRLAGIELGTGAYRRAVQRLDEVMRRQRDMGEISTGYPPFFYQTLASLLTTTGRPKEAESLMFRAWVLQERSNAKSGRAPFSYTQGILFDLAKLTSDSPDRSLLYILQEKLLVQINNPDTPAYEFELGRMEPLLAALRNSGRLDDFSKFLPLAHLQSKANAGLSGAAEPLQFPLKPFREQAFGGLDRSGLMADSLADLARIYSWSGRHAEALPLYQQCERTSRNVYGAASIKVAQAKAAIGYEKVQLNRIGEALKESREAFEIATAFVDTRAKASRKQSIAEIIDPIAAALIEAQYASWRTAPEKESPEASRLFGESFKVSQRAQHSAAALALLSLAERLSRRDPALAAVERQRQDWQEEFAHLDVQLVAAVSQGSKDEEQNIQHKIDLTTTKLTEFERQNAVKAPGALEILPAEEIRRSVLNDDEALVSFLPTADATYIWVITKAKAGWARSEMDAVEMAHEVQALRCGLDEDEWVTPRRARHCGNLLGLTEQPALSRPLPFHLGKAHNLYKALFGQFEDMIEGKRLLIAPSGPLASLPFHVLVTKAAPKELPETFEDYRGVAWLGRTAPIAVVPAVSSLNALRLNARKRQQAPEDYAGFGDPALSGDGASCRPTKILAKCPSVDGARPNAPGPGQRASVGARSGRSGASLNKFSAKRVDNVLEQVRSLCPLPDTANEIKCVAERFNDRARLISLGREATKAALKALNEDGQQLARYRILHFATHGLLASQVETMTNRRGEPALVLTPPEHPADDEDNGLLGASEISSLKLNADWVVLSACNTAAGGELGGEAFSGLARTFFFAGARALLVSHWPVYSDAAVQLTTRAFAELEHDTKAGRAEALQRAMLDLMEDHTQADNAHPAVWAPFVVVGEGGR